MNLNFENIDFKKAGFGLFFVIMIVAILPLWPDTHVHIARYDEWRFVSIVLLLSVGLYAMVSRSFQQGIVSIWTSWSWGIRGLLMLGVAIGFISTTQAALPHYGYLELVNFGLLAVLAIFVAHRVYHSPSDNSVVLLLGFAWMALAFAGYFIYQFIHLPSGESLNFKVLFDDQPNPRFISQWQGLVIPLMVGLSMFAMVQSRLVNALGWIAAILMWALVFVLGTRGVTVSLILSIILVGFLFSNLRRAWWVHNALALLAGLIVYVLMVVIQSQGGEGLIRIVSHTHVSDRLMIWEHAWMLFIESPWFGVGPMHYAHDNAFYGVPGHPHNVIFQFLAEWGAIATLAFLFVGLWAFRQWIVFLNQIESVALQWLTLALTTSFLTTSVYGLMSGIWVMPIIQLAYAMLIGWMIGIYFSINADSTMKVLNPMALISLSMGLLLMVLFFAWMGYCGYENYFVHIEQAALMSESRTVFPRFWVQGRIF